MAMSIKTPHRGAKRRPPMAEINVTPFVDVMLVLLIVFMVTAPLLTVGVSVDLPKASAPNIKGNDEPLAVSINAQGEVFLMETKLEVDELGPRLKAIAKNDLERRIFVRGDTGIPYGRVMQVMGILNDSGFTKVALVTQLPQADAPRRTGAR